LLGNHVFQGDVSLVEDFQLDKHVVAGVNILHNHRIGVGQVGEPVVGDEDTSAEVMFLQFSSGNSISHGGANPDGKISLRVHPVLQIVVDGGTVALDPSIVLESCGVLSLWCGNVDRVERKESVVEPGLVLEA